MTRATLHVHLPDSDPIEIDIVVNTVADSVRIDITPEGVQVHTPTKPVVLEMPGGSSD